MVVCFEMTQIKRKHVSLHLGIRPLEIDGLSCCTLPMTPLGCLAMFSVKISES